MVDNTRRLDHTNRKEELIARKVKGEAERDLSQEYMGSKNTVAGISARGSCTPVVPRERGAKRRWRSRSKGVYDCSIFYFRIHFSRPITEDRGRRAPQHGSKGAYRTQHCG